MAVRPGLAPLLAIGVAYAGFLVGYFVLTLLIGSEYQHSDSLSRASVFLAWSLLALAAVAVSCTSLVFVWSSLHWWLRIVAAVLNLDAIVAAQVCGHPPVIATTGWGAGYMIPGTFDYARQRYTTHDRFIFGGTVYYCTAADAEAHGLRPYP